MGTGQGRAAALRGGLAPGSFAYLGHDPSDRPLRQAAGSGWIVDGDPQALIRQQDHRRSPCPSRCNWRAGAVAGAAVALLDQEPSRLPAVSRSAHRCDRPFGLCGSLLAFAVFCLTARRSIWPMISSIWPTTVAARKAGTGRWLPGNSRGYGPVSDRRVFGLGAGFGCGLAATPSLASSTLVYAFAALAFSAAGSKTLRFVVAGLAGRALRPAVHRGRSGGGIALSGWLVVLCLFLFTALACIKRAAELIEARRTGGIRIPRRRLCPGDLAAGYNPWRDGGAWRGTGARGVCLRRGSGQAYARPGCSCWHPAGSCCRCCACGAGFCRGCRW